MKAIASLLIKQYRGIRNLRLENLNKVNIFAGPNNCGKTSVLEAVSLAVPVADKNQRQSLIDTLVSRYHRINLEMLKYIFPMTKEPQIELYWKINNLADEIKTSVQYEESMMMNEYGKSSISELNLYFDYSYVNSPEIKETVQLSFVQKDDKYSLKNHVEPNPVIDKNINLPYNYISLSRFDAVDRYIDNLDELLEHNLRNDLIEALKIFDDSITNFEVVGENRTIKIFSSKYDKALNLYDYGNGMYKAFFIIVAALKSRNGILLIDEIEAGIHAGALSKFMFKLLEVCRVNNVQLFMTTHSLEAIDTILYDCRDRNYLEEIAVYHIKNDAIKTIAKHYTGSRLIRLRDSVGFDVR